MSGNKIQGVMGEVEKTAEEDTFGPENMNENEEVGGGIEVEFNTDATFMEGGLTPPKRSSKKAIIKKKYLLITEDKSIFWLQEQLNNSSERTRYSKTNTKEIGTS